MANDNMERCSTSVTIREIPIKTTMKYHFLPTKMGVMKKYISQLPARME